MVKIDLSEGEEARGNVLHGASMAALLFRILAATFTQLWMANHAGVRAVEKNILEGLILEISPLESVRQIRFREAYAISHGHYSEH